MTGVQTCALPISRPHLAERLGLLHKISGIYKKNTTVCGIRQEEFEKFMAVKWEKYDVSLDKVPKSHGYSRIVDLCLPPAIARKKQETAGGFSAHPCYNKGIQTPEEGRTVSKTTLFDSRIKKYAYREAAQLYGELGSSPAGLSPEQDRKSVV